MSINANWPKNAVRPSDYQIDVAAFGLPMKVSVAIDIAKELESLFDVEQDKNSLEIFLFVGGTCTPYIHRQCLPHGDDGYESVIFAEDKLEYIHRIDICRKTSWKDYESVCMLGRIPEFDNTFAITSSCIKVKQNEFGCFNEALSAIAQLPGRVYSIETPELPLIALINEMDGKIYSPSLGGFFFGNKNPPFLGGFSRF